MTEKDHIVEEIEAQVIEEQLNQIIDGRMMLKLANNILVLREPSESEKYEADFFANNHVYNLKQDPKIRLYHSNLVPMLVRKECEKLGIDYSVVTKRVEITEKILKYVQDNKQDAEEFEDLDPFKAIKWYNKMRKESLTKQDADSLEQIEAIESMVGEYKLKTYEHYGERARIFFLMSRTITDKDGNRVFDVIEKDTIYGKTPVLEELGTFKFSTQDYANLIEKYNAFLKGVNPNFLSQLSGLLKGGDSSGTPVKSAESTHSEGDQQSGPEIS